MAANPDKSTFKAWLDKQPPDHHTLHVTGSVTVPTTGYTAKLVEAHPQLRHAASLLRAGVA